jgi:hypothetical protein
VPRGEILAFSRFHTVYEWLYLPHPEHTQSTHGSIGLMTVQCGFERSGCASGALGMPGEVTGDAQNTSNPADDGLVIARVWVPQHWPHQVTVGR